MVSACTLVGLCGMAFPAEATPPARELCAMLNRAAKKVPRQQQDSFARDIADSIRALALAVERFERSPEEINLSMMGRGVTALMVATELREGDVIRWLVERGADPAVRDASGRSCFDRTSDAHLLTLLRQGGIFSWDEVIERLDTLEEWPNASQEGPFSRDECLENCRAWAAGKEFFSSSDEARAVMVLCCRDLKDLQLVRFLLRSGVASLSLSEVVQWVPQEQWVSMLNLHLAHGIRLSMGGGEYPEPFRHDRAMYQWYLKHHHWADLIEHGVGLGSVEMVRVGIRRGQKDERGHRGKGLSLRSVLAWAMTAAVDEGQDEMFRFLLEQERGGVVYVETIQAVTEKNRPDLLRLVVDDKPRGVASHRGEGLEDLQSVLWLDCLARAEHPEMFRYVIGVLQGPPPAYFRADDVLCTCVRLEAEDVKGHSLSVWLETAAFLLANGADPGAVYGGRPIVEVARSEEMRRLLREAVLRKQG